MESNSRDHLKVFIVGPARSGTSIVWVAMKKVISLPGIGESHVMPAFQRMIHNFDKYRESFDGTNEDILITRLHKKDVHDHIFGYVREFYRNVHAGDCWVDKTPSNDAAHGLALIEAIFPDSRNIAMKRNGIEVVNSYTQKFGSSFEDACYAWASTMEGILLSREKCRNVIEVDQFDLVNSAADAAQRIAEHIRLPEYRPQLQEFFLNERVEKSSTHDWSRRVTLRDIGWPEQHKATFRKMCGPMMDAFGYEC